MGKEALIKIMNQYVAELMVLYIKLHNLHWLVKGPQFAELHSLYEELYNKVAADMDAVAEWLCIESHVPVASMKEALEIAQIEERVESGRIGGTPSLHIAYSDLDYMCSLVKEIRAIAESNREIVVDGMMAEHEAHYKKQLWFIRSMLAIEEE